MAPIRVAVSGIRRGLNAGGGPTAYGGVGLSPKSAKRRSPFKQRRSTLAAQQISASLSGGAAEPAATGSGVVSANIKVAVRVRPENERELTGGAYRNVIEIVDDKMLIFDPVDNGDSDFFFQGKKVGRRDLNKKAARDQKFAFDAVFGPNSTNEDVFESTTKDLVDVVFNG